MKISALFEVPTVRILLMLSENGEMRHAELARVIRSRGTLSLSLRELDEEGLTSRKIVSAKPIQAYYSLTDKGKEMASDLGRLRARLFR